MHGFLLLAESAYPVTLGPAPGGGRRLADGRLARLGAADPDGKRHLVVGERAWSMFVAQDGKRIWVHLDGLAYELIWADAVDHLAREGGGAADHCVRAPMPGAVLSVLAHVGQAVATGEPLIIIESMKLETILRAPCAGVILAVRAQTGGSFERDAVLIEIEPANP